MLSCVLLWVLTNESRANFNNWLRASHFINYITTYQLGFAVPALYIFILRIIGGFK